MYSVNGKIGNETVFRPIIYSVIINYSLSNKNRKRFIGYTISKDIIIDSSFFIVKYCLNKENLGPKLKRIFQNLNIILY